MFLICSFLSKRVKTQHACPGHANRIKAPQRGLSNSLLHVDRPTKNNRADM